MKVQKFFLSLLVLLFSLGSSVSDPECELQGLWVLDRYVYNEIEKKVQYTLMTFNFESPVSTLFWKDREHPEFCERKATFVYNPPLLYQEIIWVNPNNARECLNDEDMRLGRITTNKILLNQNELSLFLNLGDSEIIYIFKKSTPEKKQENYLEKKKNEYL